MPDRDLDRMIVELKHMPRARRAQVVDRLTLFERIQLERQLVPQRDPDDGLSSKVAELVEKLRDGPLPTITDAARRAFLAASAELGNGGAAHHLDTLSERPSLIQQLSTWLTRRSA